MPLKDIFKTKKNKPGETGPASVFGAADIIKYRKYQNRMSLNEGDKSIPLSKEQWQKTGRPD